MWYLLLTWLSCKKGRLTLIELATRLYSLLRWILKTKSMSMARWLLGMFRQVSNPGCGPFLTMVWDIIDSDNDKTSEAATVRAIFNEVGDFPVKLTQEFKRPAYVGTTEVGTTLDTTIIVRVLDSLSIGLTAFYVNPDGTISNELNFSDDSENELPASRVIRYVPTTIGEPINYLFNFEGGDPEIFEGPAEFIDVKYKRLGTYSTSFKAWRKRPIGEDEVGVTNLVKVIPSTDPVTLDEVTMKGDLVALVFSREIDPTTVEANTFSMFIRNLWNIFEPAVINATVDPTEGNVVLLELDNETVYNDDVARVTYVPGNLTSTDGIKADSFASVDVTFRKVNELKNTAFDYSFENGTVDNWVDLEWGSPFDKYSFNFSKDVAHNGARSMLLEFDERGGMIIGNKNSSGDDILFPVIQGQDYELGLWVYLVELGSTPMGGLAPDVRIYWTPETNWGIGPNPELNEESPIGEWFYSSAFVNFNTDELAFMIRGFNGANPEKVKVYIDNVTLSKVRLRP